MNTPFLHKISFFFVLISITTSCSSNLDFNQKTEDLSPNFEVKDIIDQDIYENFTVIENTNLLTSPYTIPEPLDPIPFNIKTKLKDNGIFNNLKKVVFQMTFTNTINQELIIQYDFMDDSSQSIKKGTISVGAISTSRVIEITFLESEIPNLKSVTNIVLEGSIKLTGSTISRGKLSVKSDARIYLKL